MRWKLGIAALRRKIVSRPARFLSSLPGLPPRPLPYSKSISPLRQQETSTSASSSPSTLKSSIARYAIFSLNLFLVTHLLNTYVFTVRPCTGPSMLPTIAWDGDWILISMLHRRGWHVEVGDVISYRHPIRQGYKGVKRVVGMPGDFVARDTPGRGEGWMVQVPQGHCWIVGDNLDGSRDSRHFGPLPLALVRGKVLARVWPKPAWMRNGLQAPENDYLEKKD